MIRSVSTNTMKYTIMGGPCNVYYFELSLNLCTKLAAFRMVKVNV